MNVRYAIGMVGCFLGLMSGTARAALIIDFDQVGGDVVATGTGSLDITGLNAGASFIHGQRVSGSTGFFGAGATAGVSDQSYSGFSGPTAFGPGGSVDSTSSTGDLFSIGGSSGRIYLDTTFVSGSSLTFSSTFAGQTFSSLGLTPGTYTYTLPSDSVTIDIGTVPLPASAPMFGAALVALGAVGYGLKRKQAAAAT